MDIYTISFNYPRLNTSYSSSFEPNQPPRTLLEPYTPNAFSASETPSPSNLQLANGDVSPEVVQKIVVDAMQAHHCHISFSRAEHGKTWNFYISGLHAHVVAARGMILRECPAQARSSIKVLRSDILDNLGSNPTLKPEVRRRLDEIAEQANTNISVVNPPHVMSLPPPGSQGNFDDRSSLEIEKTCELVLTGNCDCVDIARVHLLVMLDELSGLHSECCEIDHKLHGIIAARKRSVLQTIQEETGTNIYYPSPLYGAFGSSAGPTPLAAPAVPGVVPPRQNNNVLWITGDFFGVQRARDMLFQISIHKSKSVISRDAAILPRKLEWMLTDRMDDLKTIMNDNATFISFPPIGSQTSMITVYGDHRVNIQRTIRSIMQLACQFYVASFWLLPINLNILMPSSNINHAQMPTILRRLVSQSGADIIFKNDCFEMNGLEPEVRTAVQLILELDMVKGFHHEIRFQSELANEYKEFISGKKNGKLNKIMQMTNVKIKFECFNDHNFLIDVSGSDSGALQGLALLQEELPAEISFHVPESYHKRIIGVGGKSIQRIMKKYGVYVKFSNAEEFAALGGYMDNEDNVVARTPAKNAMNLENLKQSVMELVNPKDKDYIIETLSIPRRYHRTLLGEKGPFIHDIEAKTNSRVRFPDKENASDVVSIFGPESQVHIAATMLLDHVPLEAELAVPPNPELSHFCGSPEFNAFTEKMKREFQVVITPTIKPQPSPPSTASPHSLKSIIIPETSFKFRCQRSNSDCLSTVKEALEQFLIEHNIRVYPPPNSHKRADSFADAFPHFNSKLLSNVNATDTTEVQRPLEGAAERRIRLASSSPDVKALFNRSPSYIYKLPEQEYDEPEETPTAFSPNLLDDYWPPAPPMPPVAQVTRTRQTEDVLKRGSDSLLEAKIKEQITKPRSLTARAQSLDLTYSLSRITEQTSRLSPPESPTNSTYGTGGEGSPTLLSTPSFPSVYGPPGTGIMSTRPFPSQRAGRFDPEAIEEVAGAVSNMRL
ncbi:cytoplasmic protein [Sistotremastrum niveocremeum HHB9708]|uniref:Cytoplasmic protein n=1 Tax=Sistotremastrum niveocremeum HHB9708 TaxID=1314777 RepID=A0A164XNK9_9AGAM|nr:cytoplasmic protein [Sistotremastrum niveocremeum HHB9708]